MWMGRFVASLSVFALAGCPVTPTSDGVMAAASAEKDEAAARRPDPSGPLTWTADVQHWYAGDWNGGMAAAAAHVEGGYDDWRLPTVAELQAAVQDGSWGCGGLPGASLFPHWTSQSQGTSAWTVRISYDANGCPIPELSGEAVRYFKGSNFWGAKFVRP